MKTAELTGAALNWAVSMIVENSRKFPIWIDGKPNSYAAYSSDWAQGGPIIEREGISIEQMVAWEVRVADMWVATRIEGSAVSEEQGPTPLIAAMRCYVASQLGDDVKIPTDLQG